MPINPDLLVAAPMLQDYLVDKDTGMPLANGIITLWVDTSRFVTYKNWYYQTGVPGAYEYIPLDNPLHLSSVGTIQDPQGNDVIPFYYPYEETDENTPEAYFIQVYSVDENGDPAVLQFTRENFPFMPSNQSPTAQNPTWRNYIVNNVYWHNVGSLDAMTVLDSILCASQHEGYTNGDIRFIKNVAGANDDIAFLPMTETLDNDITPEVYLNFQCSGVQVGETVKCIQYPVSLHVKTLQNVLASLVIHAQNVAGSGNNFLDLYVYQYLGTGALSQPDPILIKRIVLNNDFQKFVIPLIFPDAEGLVLGNGGDDALFIRVQYPLSALFNINHTKPQLYLSTDVPDNDFDTYDDINAITDSPRTGDHRISFNNFQPYGWVGATNGTIGNAASGASTRANTDTWPLYNLLWNSTQNFWCPVSGGRGSSAIADFNANKTLTLSRTLGYVISGTNPDFVTPQLITAVNTVTGGITVGGNAPETGTAVVFYNTGGALPSGITANTIYFAWQISTSVFGIFRTIDDAIALTNPVIITTTGSGSNFVANALGSYQGASNHTMTLAELIAHHHTVPFVSVPNILQSGGGQNLVNPGTTDTSTTGSSPPTPFNIIQPTTYRNIFLKL